jgi:DEAD/DEAH box helicase domain-containing protein
VDLRGAGSQISIEDADTGEVIGAVDSLRARRETHPGAVYLHRGRSYLVHSLDIPGTTVKARAARVGFSTRVRSSKDTEILEILGRRELLGTRVSLARLKVTEHITGYEKRSTRGGELLGMVALDMPPSVFETEGIWFDVPDEARRAAEAEYLHFMGGIHAVEHAAIGILPLLVLTDRNDLGGISTPMHPQTGGAAVFIYDAMPAARAGAGGFQSRGGAACAHPGRGDGLPLRAGLPVLRALAQVRQRQPAHRQGRCALSAAGTVLWRTRRGPPAQHHPDPKGGGRHA